MYHNNQKWTIAMAVNSAYNTSGCGLGNCLLQLFVVMFNEWSSSPVTLSNLWLNVTTRARSYEQ